MLFGHEHNPSGKSVVQDEKNRYVIIDGGMLSNEGISDSSFNVLMLDTSEETLKAYEYSWSDLNRLYSHVPIVETKYRNTNRSTSHLSLSPDYLDTMREDTELRLSKKFQDYYVFPKIERRSNEDFTGNAMISTLEDFIDEIYKNKYILLEGNDKCGKTALSKHLYLTMMKESTPLYFNTDNVRNKEMNKVVEYAFREQYSDDPIAFQQYLQLDNSSRITIIDNVESIKPEQLPRLIEYFKDTFDKIILFSKAGWNFNIPQVSHDFFWFVIPFCHFYAPLFCSLPYFLSTSN